MVQNLIELNEETDKYMIIIREFCSSLSKIDRISRQKSRKDIENSKNAIHQLDLGGQPEENMFFSCMHRTLTK